MPKYLGYAHIFYYPDENGKAYEQGDNIPIGKHEVARLVAMGHKFEDAEAPPLETASVAVAPDVPAAVSLDEVAEASVPPKEPAPAEHALVPTAPVESSPPVPAAVVFGRPQMEDDTRRSPRRG